MEPISLDDKDEFQPKIRFLEPIARHFTGVWFHEEQQMKEVAIPCRPGNCPFCEVHNESRPEKGSSRAEA